MTAPVVAELLRRARLEVMPLAGVEERVLEHVPKDVKITVTASPARGLDSTLELCGALARQGYPVVPHISARLVVDERHLAEILRQVEALPCNEVFVVAGDVPEPAGKFEDAPALLAAMAELGSGIEEVGITGYPESHPFVSDEATIQAMYEKEPHATYIVSQLAFDAATIGGWVRNVRARGVSLPIYIGIPGPVSRTKLVRFAARIGMGESARFATQHTSWIRRLLSPKRVRPERLLDGLAPYLEEPGHEVRGVHIYTFNEVEQTQRWLRER